MILRKMGLAASFAVYIPAALLMYLMTHCLIPYLRGVTGQESIVFWFIVGGLGIFTPLIITGILILRHEGFSLSADTWRERLRFRPMTGRQWLWALGGLMAAGTGSGLVMLLLEMITGGFDHSPSFMAFEPLHAGRYWLLLLWLPYWILNIMGEEFLWRGVMLPRQELAFGRNAWLIHGIGWWMFHFAFGWHLMLMLMPLIFIQSWVVQKTRNSWVGVIMHAGLNGPSFLAISFGLI